MTHDTKSRLAHATTPGMGLGKGAKAQGRGQGLWGCSGLPAALTTRGARAALLFGAWALGGVPGAPQRDQPFPLGMKKGKTDTPRGEGTSASQSIPCPVQARDGTASDRPERIDHHHGEFGIASSARAVQKHPSPSFTSERSPSFNTPRFNTLPSHTRLDCETGLPPVIPPSPSSHWATRSIEGLTNLWSIAHSRPGTPRPTDRSQANSTRTSFHSVRTVCLPLTVTCPHRYSSATQYTRDARSFSDSPPLHTTPYLSCTPSGRRASQSASLTHSHRKLSSLLDTDQRHKPSGGDFQEWESTKRQAPTWRSIVCLVDQTPCSGPKQNRASQVV